MTKQWMGRLGDAEWTVVEDRPTYINVYFGNTPVDFVQALDGQRLIEPDRSREDAEIFARGAVRDALYGAENREPDDLRAIRPALDERGRKFIDAAIAYLDADGPEPDWAEGVALSEAYRP